MGDYAPEPAGLEPEAAPDAGAEPEPWAGPDQESWEGVQSTLERLGPLLEYLEQAPPEGEGEGGEQGLELDLFGEPESVVEQLRGLIREELAPYASYAEEGRRTESEQRALDIIADLTAEGGEFLDSESTQIARNLANDFYPELAQRYGHTPKAAEAALGKAVDAVREFEQRIGKAYHERQMNELQGLAGVRREPEAAGRPAAQQVTTREGGNEMDLVRSIFGAGSPR